MDSRGLPSDVSFMITYGIMVCLFAKEHPSAEGTAILLLRRFHREGTTSASCRSTGLTTVCNSRFSGDL
jgi:hypothetical protein